MIAPFPGRATMQNVVAICLDLDDTLWAVGPAIERAEQALLEWLDRHCPRVTALHDLASMRSLRVQVAEEFPGMRHDFTFLRREALLRHARQAGYPESVADQAFEVFYAARNQVEPFADVVPALERLGRRYRLMSLSNGNADLGVIGLAQFFEHSVAAREAGAAKPDRRIFDSLLDRAGLEPGQVAYVGDDPQADVEGARSAGMHAVWMDRFGRAWPDGLAPPAYRVRDLGELAALLG
jgi:FMN hydrolase / 5-amino-6-(5-phospho-D-ribitylamino)uracil phosphatase